MKPRLSPNDTYVFEDEDVDALDEFSITSILEDELVADELGEFDDTIDSLEITDETAIPAAEAVAAPGRQDAVRRPAGAQETVVSPDPAATMTDREPTIDELIDGSYLGPKQVAKPVANDQSADTGTFAALEVLLPPEAIFGKPDDDED